MTILFDQLGIPESARDIATILQDYDHELHLEKLPPQHPYMIGQPDKPYAIMHRPQGLPEYVVESFPASMLDERLLAIVFEWDTRRFGKQLDKFAALDNARHIRAEKKRADDVAEGNDRMAFLMNKRRWE